MNKNWIELIWIITMTKRTNIPTTHNADDIDDDDDDNNNNKKNNNG